MQVDIPQVGLVEFPDSMSQEEVTSAIKTKIWPQVVAKTGTIGPATLGQRFQLALNSTGPGRTLLATPHALFGSEHPLFENVNPHPQTVLQGAQTFGENLANTIATPGGLGMAEVMYNLYLKEYLEANNGRFRL